MDTKHTILNIACPIDLQHLVSTQYAAGYLHIHNHYEIYITLTDGLRFLVNNKSYCLNKGDVMLFNSNDLHQVSVPENCTYERCFISFDAQIVAQCFPHLLACFDRRDEQFSHLLSLNMAEQNSFQILQHTLQNALCTQDSFSQTEQHVALFAILLFLNRIAQHPSIQSLAPDNSHCPNNLQAIQNYIDLHFCEQITLENIAKQFFINKNYLCRAFKKQFGFTVTDYITFKRISKSITLLQQGISVCAVAEQCGFNSSTYFSNVFKRALGKSPRYFLQ